MIRRLFWLGLAAAAGVVVYRKLARTAQSYTPSGLAASAQRTAAGLLDSMRIFVADVREGMAEREAEILAALAENASGARAGDLDDVLAELHGRPHLHQQEGEPER